MELGPILRAMSRHKPRFGLTALQIALTLAILANCVSLIQDARQKMSRPPVFDEENLMNVVIPCLDPALVDDHRADIFMQDNLARLRSFPGVRAASHALFWPWGGTAETKVKPVGAEREVSAGLLGADEHFPDAVGAEIDEGRWFTREEVDQATEWERQHDYRERQQDGKAVETVVGDIVVSRALGEHLFGPGPLVGKMVEDRDGDRGRIIGVLREFSNPAGAGGFQEKAVIYPGRFRHCRFGGHLYILVRAQPGKSAFVAKAIEEWHAQTYEYDGPRVRLVEQNRGLYFASQRMTVVLLGCLIVLLVIVASLGVAGATSISVTQRIRQIGVRRALGATPRDILRYFLTESALVATIGLAFGAGLSVLLNMVLLRIFDGAKLDALIVLGCALLLWFVATGAALPPALRASRVSPAIATRNV